MARFALLPQEDLTSLPLKQQLVGLDEDKLLYLGVAQAKGHYGARAQRANR